MKVVSVVEVISNYIIMEPNNVYGPTITEYRRFKDSTWQALVNSSWEYCYTYEDLLEKAYQQYLLENT